MSDLRARVSYLQGLADGLDLHENGKEGKLLQGIIDVLTDFAEEIEELQIGQDQLEDYIETVDEDLYALEDEVYEEYDDEDEGFCDCGEECDEFVEVDCPNCGETVMFDSDILEDSDTIEVICPNCDDVVFINDDCYTSADEGEELISAYQED
ncbi:CD1247 N-terminal domain-containing protein [Peptococcaceae bacterium 1198_IL3148]